MQSPRNSILFLGLLSAFSLLTFDLYQPSLPSITNYFEISPSLGQLSLTIYLIVYGAMHLVWGPLVDHYGRRRLLPGNLLIALIGSLLCAYAGNIYMLLIGRSLQGFALCCANLIAYSSSRDYEEANDRAKVISYINMTVSISPIIAPVFGAILFSYMGWQANFIVMAIVSLVLMIQSNKSLVESPYWTPPKVAFSLQQVINAYKAILPRPTLWYSSLIMMFSFSAVMLTVINSSYLIIDVLNYSPLAYGIIFIFNGLNIIFGNYLGIWLRKYLRMQTSIYIGHCFIIFGGIAMLLVTKLYEFNLVAFSFSLISNLGISISAPPTMSLALDDFAENPGIATGFINTLRLIGSSLCTILIGYWLINDLDALPVGLILTGFGALIFSRQFNKRSNPSVSSNLAGKEITT
ncbi:multidrug effflux MFS transporter [Legionella waltersii]|uniref:Multidrug resistance protein D n=1 Tax=Legionella waltersii TaxID=66969 RepID=A0A0W1ABR2_9GAMM|nr:multidrug effflux MFS transporter [Legionella waltersii]KTD78765.1 multidrug resistance protein D [Legionella waltersii]SNV11249.1 multidrug resistance protein D [Legionella waltersii]